MSYDIPVLYKFIYCPCNILLLPTSIGHRVKVLKLQNILLPDKSKQYVIHIPSLNNFSEYNITMPKYYDECSGKMNNPHILLLMHILNLVKISNFLFDFFPIKLGLCAIRWLIWVNDNLNHLQTNRNDSYCINTIFLKI